MNVTLARKAETVRRCGSRPAQRIGHPIAATTNRWPPIIQAKLRISSPTDKYEREANRVADQMMRMPEPEMAMTDVLHGSETVQNTRAACRDGEELCSECEEQLQRQTEDQFRDRPESWRISSVPPLEAKIRSIQGGGEPLTASQRDFFEPRFGMDFSAIRLHTGSGAGEMARSLEARAFTFGSEIVFGESEYDPGSPAGLHLLAHELTHVQQGCKSGQVVRREPDSPARGSVSAPAVTSVIFSEHPSEPYHGFDPHASRSIW